LNFFFISSLKDIKDKQDDIEGWIKSQGHLPLALEFPNTQNIYFFLPVMKDLKMDKRMDLIIDMINHEVIECLTAYEHKQIGFHSILTSIGLKDLREYLLPFPTMKEIVKKWVVENEI